MIKRLLVLTTAASLLSFPGSPTQALPQGTTVETYKGGLNFPIDMAWVPGTKKVFFTEKDSGKIRVLVGKRLKRRACVNLDVQSDGERGALGLALHPRFKDNGLLYVYYTNASPVENRVTRFKVVDDRCTNANHIVTGLRSSSGYHTGGQLEFVGGKLFVSVGESHEPAAAQDRDSRLGKILRINPDGSVPEGNPFGDSPVWSTGHRNPFGLTHKPGSSRIYETENGPSCDDEVNRIVKGRNYGWGDNYRCGSSGVGPNPKAPIRRYSDVIVPTDPWWYRGRMKSLSGSLYVGGFGDERLHRLVLNRRGTKVKTDRVIHSGDPIVDVSKGPGGWLYFMTPSAIRRIVPR